jgi:hypothetical protein
VVVVVVITEALEETLVQVAQVVAVMVVATQTEIMEPQILAVVLGVVVFLLDQFCVMAATEAQA